MASRVVSLSLLLLLLLLLQLSCWSAYALSVERRHVFGSDEVKSVVAEMSGDKVRLKLAGGQVLIGNRKRIVKRTAAATDSSKATAETPSANGEDAPPPSSAPPPTPPPPLSPSFDEYVYEFLGLPFAQPPIYEKRFQFPQRLDKTLSTQHAYDATYSRPSCWQEVDTTFGADFDGSQMWNPPHNVSEDCLYMNIWVPVSGEQDARLFASVANQSINTLKYMPDAFSLDAGHHHSGASGSASGPTNVNSNRMLSDAERKATLFWIFGGSYNSGSANLRITDGTTLAALEHVIVVSANYRVGPFGFMFLNNSLVPGNAGLADQVLAIEWYRERYLTYFGGSSSKVCLFGESSGSMSLHNLLLSDKSSLINRVIFQSSSSYQEFSYRKPQDALKVTHRFIQSIGCLDDDYEQQQPLNTNTSRTRRSFRRATRDASTTTYDDEALAIRGNIRKMAGNGGGDEQTRKLSGGASSTPDDKDEMAYLNDFGVESPVWDCLMSLEASVFSAKQWEVDYVNAYLKMQFVPTIDYNRLIVNDPFEYDLRQQQGGPSGNGNARHPRRNQEILVGINQNEGSYFTFYMYNGVYFDLNGHYVNDTLVYDNEFVVQRLTESLRTKWPEQPEASKSPSPSPSPPPSGDANANGDEYFFKKYARCISNLYTHGGTEQSSSNNSLFLDDQYNGTYDFDLDKAAARTGGTPQTGVHAANMAWRKFNKIIGDFVFNCPSVKLANKYSEVNPYKTFFYKFNKRSFGNPWPDWLGTMHGYEIEYVFGMPFVLVDAFDDQDRAISLRIMNYWANFARTGKLSSDYEPRARSIFVDLSTDLLKNEQPDESAEYDRFNEFFRHCRYFNKIPAGRNYFAKYELCAKYEQEIGAAAAGIPDSVVATGKTAACRFAASAAAAATRVLTYCPYLVAHTMFLLALTLSWR